MDEISLLIAELKEQFGEVYQIRVEEDVYFFRLLTRKEYTDVLNLTPDKDAQDELFCQLAVVYPEGMNFAEGDAGMPQTIAPFIINESGFGNLKKADMYFDSYKTEMNSFERQAEALIQAAFPHISEDEMMNWNVSRFMKTAAKAEWILREVHGRDIAFQRVEIEEGEEVEEKEPPTFKELGNELRKEGLDPMIEYAPFLLKPKPFAEVPFIGGTQYWKKVF